jgi:hypothetical protein
MFRAQSAHHQEDNDADCKCAVSGIVTLCKWLSCATAKESVMNKKFVYQVGNNKKGSRRVGILPWAKVRCI